MHMKENKNTFEAEVCCMDAARVYGLTWSSYSDDTQDNNASKMTARIAPRKPHSGIAIVVLARLEPCVS
jgi:hypothetical protein